MLKDDKWPIARLIPISSASGIEAQERRAASALLAVMHAVPEFGRALLKPLGAPSGRVEAFIEVPFKFDGRLIRPDGIVTVLRGNKHWGAIIEAKVGSMSLDPQQMNQYLDLARELGFNAVLSISNQFVSSSTQYPIEVDKRKLRKVRLHHWSWVRVLTEAVLQKEHRGVSDPDQAYILGELIRYLSDPRSGAVSFDSMGPSWTKVREGTRHRTLRRNDPEVSATAARWDDLMRYLCLELTKDLGQDVKQLMASAERTPAARLSALCESLADSGRLYGQLNVPNAAGSLHVVADLHARQVVVSTRIDAPKKGTSRGRVSWLVRQLQDAPDDLVVAAKIARSTQSLAASLMAAKEDPSELYPESGKEIRQFVVSARRNMGLKRDASMGSFIQSVVGTTKEFYRDILQNLRAWKAAPPRLKESPLAAEEEPPSEGLPEPLAEGIRAAEEESPSPDLGKGRED